MGKPRGREAGSKGWENVGTVCGSMPEINLIDKRTLSDLSEVATVGGKLRISKKRGGGLFIYTRGIIKATDLTVRTSVNVT